MKILILEDEMLAFKRLSKLLVELLPDAIIEGPIDSVTDAIEWFKNNEAPAVLFSDVQLSDGITFDFINVVKPNCPIIFTTAFDQYALDAFKTTGVDYLLKPVKKEGLILALDKLKDMTEMFQQSKVTTASFAYKERFLVRFGMHLKSIGLDEIAYFFSENKSTFIKTKEGRDYPIDSNLDSLESIVDPQKFFRLNRQYLVHHAAIKSMKAHTKARVIVCLQPEAKEEPVVSSTKSGLFKLWLSGEIH